MSLLLKAEFCVGNSETLFIICFTSAARQKDTERLRYLKMVNKMTGGPRGACQYSSA